MKKSTHFEAQSKSSQKTKIHFSQSQTFAFEMPPIEISIWLNAKNNIWRERKRWIFKSKQSTKTNIEMPKTIQNKKWEEFCDCAFSLSVFDCTPIKLNRCFGEEFGSSSMGSRVWCYTWKLISLERNRFLLQRNCLSARRSAYGGNFLNSLTNSVNSKAIDLAFWWSIVSKSLLVPSFFFDYSLL